MDITNMTESTAAYKHFMSNALYTLPQPSRYGFISWRDSIKSNFFLISSNITLAQLPSSQGIVEQYDQLYQESIKSLQAATEKVVSKEAELLKLQKEIQELKDSKN